MKSVFLCVTIDCECDKGPGWRTQLPMRFTGVAEGIARRLQPLFIGYRAKPTYLLSSEVIRDATSADVLDSLPGSHELGTHLHGEYVDGARPAASVTSELQRDYPREVERRKLRLLTEQFSSTFGYRPRSFRAGRFGVGENSMPLLEELGYAVDSSVTPFVEWTSAGARRLSFVGAPTQPYRPDRSLPACPGDGAILEVPVTIRPNRWQHLPIAGRFLPARWLRPTFSNEHELVEIARDEIARAREENPGRPVILNAMLHNVEIVPGASPYAGSDRSCRRILERLAGLLRFAEREGICGVGLTDVAGIAS